MSNILPIIIGECLYTDKYTVMLGPIHVGVGSGLGILALLAIILGAVILVTVCHRSRGSIQLKDK